jgi:uncharacterized protein (TIGR03435 family)
MARQWIGRIVIGLFSVSAPAAAQHPLAPGTDSETFEVASIKQTSRAQVPIPQILPNGTFQISGATLNDLIRFAYPTGNGQIIVDKAPAWMATDRFDVIAKTNGARPTAAMLRALLSERFRLRARLEPREGDVLELKLARKDGRLGPGLTKVDCGPIDQPPATAEEALARTMAPAPAATAGPCQAMRIGCCPVLIGEGVTIGDLARTLTYAPIFGGAPIVDRTGLSDRYSFRLQYRGDNNPNPDAGPLLPTAIEEQLGLKVERTRGTIDVVVIDQVAALEAN